ncbi:MAG: hypothetical protein AAF449_10940, partial [Myxococcota bacterium]
MVIISSGCSNEGPDADQVIPVNDFDSSDWGERWMAEGTAFLNSDGSPRKPPSNGWGGRLQGAVGQSLVDTYVAVGDDSPDEATGRLTSPDILIQRRYLNFLIEGGTHSALSNQPTTVEVIVDGELRHFYTGDGDFPLELRPHSMDLGDWDQGSLQIRISDRHRGSFGFISADEIVMSDTLQTLPDQILATFENPENMLSSGRWQADGDLASPDGINGWAGTSRNSTPSAARAIGDRALSTCELAGPGTSCVGSTGTLTSSMFNISARYLNFAVVGGDGVQDVGIELLDADNNVLESFRPSQCRRALSCENDWRFFDLQPYLSRQVRLRIFDRSSTGCGFISIDHIYLSRFARGFEAITRFRTATDQINVQVPPDGFD